MLYAQTNPSDLRAVVAALGPDDRALLQTFLEEPSLSLLALARKLSTDLAGLAARVLSDSFQSALAAICLAADSLARLRAAAGGPAALNTLSTACLADTVSVTQRRLAATAILRFTNSPPRRHFVSPPAPSPRLGAERMSAKPTGEGLPPLRSASLPTPGPRSAAASAPIPSKTVPPDPIGPIRPISPIRPLPLAPTPARLANPLPASLLSAAGLPHSRDRPTLSLA